MALRNCLIAVGVEKERERDREREREGEREGEREREGEVDSCGVSQDCPSKILTLYTNMKVNVELTFKCRESCGSP